MTEQKIKRAKKLAEILGVIVESDGQSVYKPFDFCKQFNPEQDKSLLWDLMLDHNVEIAPWCDNTSVVYIEDQKTCERLVTVDDVLKENVPAALIDCIIAVNGGY